jgi:glycosyltransferase involved in cell wall biosynthesis
MRILLVHNFYGSSAPSGENSVVLEEAALLRAAGHEVIEHFTYSDSLLGCGRLRILQLGASVPWNPSALARLRQAVRRHDPDVMHVHNVFPLLSPAAFYAASRARTAVVATLHNYRTACANPAFMRDSRVCTECLDRQSTLPALRHGCYKDSHVASIPLASCIALHRRLRTYARCLDACIALTGFQRDLLVRAGLPAARIAVKPNCMPHAVPCLPMSSRERKAVFIGRLSAEKGTDVLLKAWDLWGAAAPALEVIGGGPDFESLRASAPHSASNIVFRGRLSREETFAALSRARMIVMPSLCFEAFPLAMRDALAFGVPVAASSLGAFRELIELNGAGRLFTPGDPASLLAEVSALWNDPAALNSMSLAARAAFEARYTPDANLTALTAIYTQAIAEKGRFLQTGERLKEPAAQPADSEDARYRVAAAGDPQP